jgi:hypothetical protein
MEAPTQKRIIPGWAVAGILALMVTVALLVNMYNHSQQQQNIDHGTDDIVCTVDPTDC